MPFWAGPSGPVCQPGPGSSRNHAPMTICWADRYVFRGTLVAAGETDAPVVKESL